MYGLKLTQEAPFKEFFHVELQVRLNTTETLKAKKQFEQMFTNFGIVLQDYITDAGTSFTSSGYHDHLSEFRQINTQAAPGGHDANGIAECNIGAIMSISRAMLHHSAVHWPEVSDVVLWPMALQHAVYLLNRIPCKDCGCSPLELFSRKTWGLSKFKEFHVWGCPAYVLDSTLSNGRSIPRWKPHSGRSMYMGNSTTQGHGVPVVLNLDTGKITSQFHVVLDDWFQTVDSSVYTQINFNTKDWYGTYGLTKWQYIPDDSLNSELHNIVPAASSEGADCRITLQEVRDARLQFRFTQVTLFG